MNKVIEQHRKEILAAGDDPIKIIAANAAFWGRKLSYLNHNESPANLILFNSRSVGSYHPLNANVMGEVYGELELFDLIPIKDYLDLPPSVDNFLHGVAKGKEKAIKRKNTKPPKGGKGKNGYGDINQAAASLVDDYTKGK